MFVQDAVIDFENTTSTLDLYNTIWEAFRICIPQGTININANSLLKSTDQQEGLIKKECKITIAKETILELNNFVIQGNPVSYAEETSKLRIDNILWELDKNTDGHHLIIVSSNNILKAPEKKVITFEIDTQTNDANLKDLRFGPNCEVIIDDFVLTDGTK
jgi:hypothetical protein